MSTIPAPANTILLPAVAATPVFGCESVPNGTVELE
jgi:hypothetical protein